ncbi:hypothetical protein [Legionella worsleiensis]|uniref:Uncharacterized protein n=1 Tax=Legionella worsleiensis TaxID=45076 RepID=A0A0W1AEL6_9GAMM|nr:hypothetical protein [Legionella worsleiensis]KTD79781.1 hypothetical protein Lwor_1295 [Legionella worsleiensis]STY32292.1 Uncharacterised protein [Legionella worsleiensis]
MLTKKSASSAASSTTDPNNVSKTEHELDRIFKAQAMRVMTLSAGFSALGKCKMELPKELSIADIPPASFARGSAKLLYQMVDTGRANSGIPQYKKHGISLFHDAYHREAFFETNAVLSLTQSSCIIATPDSTKKLIPVVRFLLPLIYRYLLMKSGGQGIYTFIRHLLPIKHLKCTEHVVLIQIPGEETNNILHHLGMLGALPNRDWQLKYFAERYDSVTEMRDRYLYLMSILYIDQIPQMDQALRIKNTHGSYEEQKNTLLMHLNHHNQCYRTGMEKEQRLFYSQFLTKLIHAISFDEATSDLQLQLHSLFSLQRIKKMLKNSTALSYPAFLRTIEACIDEITILLTLLHYNQEAEAASQTSEIAKQFITDTVGITPQMMTLRSSAMQAIWSSFDMALAYFRDKEPDKPITVFIPHTIYFEVVNILKKLFHLPLYQHEQDLSTAISSNIFSTDFIGEEIPYSSDVMYDLIITNFESNIQFNSNGIEFTDINALVENQFRLRRVKQEHDKPLIVIIDNTMSDFDDVYLPFFLMEFNEEINSGTLCVLISHSGNKYVHLGTDKALAALMYGYYNPYYFTQMDALINEELRWGPGDFDYSSPTVLLTKAFLKHGKEEILAYSSLIRQRTWHVFNSIPKELVNNSGYFTIDNPVSNATYKHLAPSCTTLQNSCGFIIIKCNKNAFFAGNIHNHIFTSVNRVLMESGIEGRDGFGFSQTTKVYIRMPGSADAIRISIGTESLDDIVASIRLVCDYLIEINKIMEGYRNNTTKSKIYINTGNPYFTHLFAAVDAIYQQAIKQLSILKDDSKSHAQCSM